MLTIDPSHTAEITRRTIAVTRWPGGYWAVKLRQRGTDTVAFAVPRRGTVAAPFDIAVAVSSEPADVSNLIAVAVDWTIQARTLAGRPGACVYAGTGDATEETLLTAGTWYAQVARPTDLLDRLLVARAADELKLNANAEVYRRELEDKANAAVDALKLTPCTHTHGDDGDALMCERAAGHAGPCAALVLFPSPSGKFATPVVTTDAVHSLDGGPNWKPLEQLSDLSTGQIDEFMWMGFVQHDGVRIEQYKHLSTRRYLNLDADGTAYRIRVWGEPTTHEIASIAMDVAVDAVLG
jgi:hypothetical protein